MKSSHTGSLTHGQVVHELNRRIRINSPVFLKDPERACVLEIMLQKRDGIEKVRTVPDIASIVTTLIPISYRKQSGSSFWMRYWCILAKGNP